MQVRISYIINLNKGTANHRRGDVYEGQCIRTVEKVLKDTRNKPDIEVQQALIKAFPFHRSNIVAWRAYGKEIKRQSGRVMF